MPRLAFVALVAILTSWAPLPHAQADDPTRPWLDAELPRLQDLYQHLHSHPELSLHEAETAARIAAELREAGCQVTTGVGGHGVVGILTNGSGPRILVRTDLDALPVTEATGLPYASQLTTKNDAGESVGVMHACGHDMHMTCFVATARWLAAHKDRWAGTVLFVAQPAEERVVGARAMLDDGLYTRFGGKPDAALALHVSHELPHGQIGVRAGPAFAASSALDITVKGLGGHGAQPHQATDPIVLAALLVLDLQTIVSREISPVEPAVITVGSIQGGTKHNIIPSEVKLQLTLRAYKDEVLDRLIIGIRRRVAGLATAHNAPPGTVTINESVPPTVNNPDLVKRLLPTFERALGARNVIEVEPTMGAEDFGLFARDDVPIFMFRLGTVDPARVAQALAGGPPLPAIHSALFAPVPEPSLRAGVRSMTAALCELMPPARTSP